MKNGSMFQSLSNYKRQEYYDAHPVMLLLTPEENYQIEIFAGYVSATDGDAWQLNFETDEERDAWLGNACSRSYFKSGIVPSANDHIITLSTCSYEFDNARFVVVGILSGEADVQ